MPVKILDNLPAISILREENIFVMPASRAGTQDIRPLHIAILNLMPTKIVTETQLLRVIGNTPLQVEVTFLRTASHLSRNTPLQHLEAFYKTFDEVREQNFDGLIITGAPVEQMDFAEVRYWEELTAILDWAADHAPHSRHTEVRLEDIEKVPDLEVLAVSPEAGVYLAASRDGKHVFVTGHAEYDADTLKNEYERDRAKGLPIAVPRHYFPDDNPSREPLVTWRAHANLLYANWLNYYVYQETPYDLSQLAKKKN